MLKESRLRRIQGCLTIETHVQHKTNIVSLPHQSRQALLFFFFNDTATSWIYTLSLHDALPIWVRNRRQLNSLQNTWPYGYSMPIAVRYTQDAFSRSGWLWPVDAKGEPLKATSYMAVGFYVAKYVNKKSDMDLAAKGLGAKE